MGSIIKLTALVLVLTDFANSELQNSEQKGIWLIPFDRRANILVNDSYSVSCQTADENVKKNLGWVDPQGNKIDTSINSRIHVVLGEGVELKLTRLSLEDSGVYTCVTPFQNISLRINVIQPIVFDDTLEEQSAGLGEDYEMKCEAQSHFKPRIYWKVDMKNPARPKYKLTKDGGLIIYNVTQADGRRHYMCRALDLNSPIPATKIMNITLNIEEEPTLRTLETTRLPSEALKPGTPILELESVSVDTATIIVILSIPNTNTQHRVNSQVLPAEEFVVQYRNNSMSDWIATNVSESEGGFSVLGLSPGTTFLIRAAAKNEAGFGEFSFPILITTSFDNDTNVFQHLGIWLNSIIGAAQKLFFPWL